MANEPEGLCYYFRLDTDTQYQIGVITSIGAGIAIQQA